MSASFDGTTLQEKVTMPRRILRLPRPAVAAVLILLSACHDTQGPTSSQPGSNSGSGPVELASLIVSNPDVAALVMAALPPGSIPEADRVVIQNRKTGAQAVAAIVDGGFDPVALGAAAGDTLGVTVSIPGHRIPLDYVARVPQRSPPVIVRTDPAPKKRDVPLNTVTILVFSEPLDPATVNPESVQLQLNGMPVPGTLAFADSARLVVTFTPAAPLAPNTSYTMVATPAVQDLDGEPLGAPATIGFVTQGDLSDLAGTYERLSPHTLYPGYYSRYVLRADGTFEFHAEDAGSLSPGYGGSLIITGQYSRVDSSRITLTFDSNGGGTWVATGTVAGDSLRLTYSAPLAGQLEDGSYLRGTPATLPPADLAFSRGGNLYLMNADGTLLRQLTGDSLGADWEPAWSPDGSRIAFTRYRQDLGNPGLGEAAVYLINADGTGLARLSAQGAAIYDAHPTWSPDGSRIAFHSMRDADPNDPQHANDSEIYVMNADGTNPVRLTTLQGNLWWPAWSPDGSRIASFGLPPGNYGMGGMFVMQEDGSNLTEIPLPGYPSAFGPDWSPDGASLLMQTQYCLQWTGSVCTTWDGPHLTSIAPDGTNPVQLSGYGLNPQLTLAAWSPDGGRIVFGQTCGGVPPFTCPELLSILRISDGQVTLLTSGSAPAWRR